MKYRIVKLFIGGLLKGLTYEYVSSVKFEVGFICHKPIGGSPYKIISVTSLLQNNH